MTNPIRNERGAAALLYVVLISLVLLVATPVILSTVSTDASHGVMNRNTQMAENMAASGLEAFIRYLDKYNGSSDGQRLQYLNQYGGFISTPITYANPEGVPITYSFVHSETGTGTNIFTIQSSASAGVEPYKRTKTITYQIDANMPVTTTYVDPNDRQTLSGNQNILVEGERKPPDGVSAQERLDLKAPIHDAIAFYRANGEPSAPPVPAIPTIPSIDTEINGYWDNTSTPSCSCSNLTEVRNKITELSNMTTNNPIILRINNGFSNWDNNPSQITFGTLARPVILLFGGDITFGGNGDVKINVVGGLIVKNGGIHMNGSSNSALTVSKSSTGNYGYLSVSGAISNNNPAKITVEGTVFSNTISSLKKDFKAGNLKTTGSVNIDSYPMDISGGNMVVNSFSGSAGSSLKAGKLYVDNDFSSNSAPITISGSARAGTMKITGGSFQAGTLHVNNNFTMENSATTTVSGSVRAGTMNITGGSFKAGTLYVDNSYTMTNSGTATITGSTRAGTLSISGSGSSFTSESVYTTGGLVLSNETLLKATAGDINVDSFSLSTNSTISARNLIVRQALNIYNDSHISLTGDALLGEMHVHTSGAPGIVATMGDILVEGDVTAGNNITLVAGGYIGAGGNFNINNGYGVGSNIQAGGGTTSLHLSGSGSSGGTTTTPGAWKPKRVG
ncbi:MAG: hypothetical protein J7639_10205 [Paenibacillaceae bacterium]|nr:hypothetical protein [Paenibacillaceae bacterium]